MELHLRIKLKIKFTEAPQQGQKRQTRLEAFERRTMLQTGDLKSQL